MMKKNLVASYVMLLLQSAYQCWSLAIEVIGTELYCIISAYITVPNPFSLVAGKAGDKSTKCAFDPA